MSILAFQAVKEIVGTIVYTFSHTSSSSFVLSARFNKACIKGVDDSCDERVAQCAKLLFLVLVLNLTRGIGLLFIF